MSTIDRREGRAYAAGVVQAVISAPRCFFDERGPLGTVLANLESTAATKPADWAAGVLDVVGLCREVAA